MPNLMAKRERKKKYLARHGWPEITASRIVKLGVMAENWNIIGYLIGYRIRITCVNGCARGHTPLAINESARPQIIIIRSNKNGRHLCAQLTCWQFLFSPDEDVWRRLNVISISHASNVSVASKSGFVSIRCGTMFTHSQSQSQHKWCALQVNAVNSEHVLSLNVIL